MVSLPVSSRLVTGTQLIDGDTCSSGARGAQTETVVKLFASGIVLAALVPPHGSCLYEGERALAGLVAGFNRPFDPFFNLCVLQTLLHVWFPYSQSFSLQ
jgi:hypothetical protein